MNHTPLPWYIDTKNCSSSDYAIQGSDLKGSPLGHSKGVIAVTPKSRTKPTKENVLFIVQACNAHYALLEACKEALICATIQVPYDEQIEKARNVIKLLESAIEKANTTPEDYNTAFWRFRRAKYAAGEKL